MVCKSIFAGLLAASVLAVGCSSTEDDPPASNGSFSPPENCSIDPSLDCANGSMGISCASGSNPVDEDSTLSCSSPSTVGTEDTYCCVTAFTGSATTCQPDDDVALGCVDGTVGFSCSTGDDPTSYDASLSCSAPTVTGAGASLFCCGSGGDAGAPGDDDGDGTPPAGCTFNPSLGCAGNAEGLSCTGGNDPEALDTTLTCSAPKRDPQTDEDVYCCFTGFNAPSAATCLPDDDVGLACAAGSFGFACAAGDTSPETQDPDLTMCSASSTAGDQDDYCCVYD